MKFSNLFHLSAALISLTTAHAVEQDIIVNGTFTGGTSGWAIAGTNSEWADTKGAKPGLHSSFEDGLTDTQGYLWHVAASGSSFTATQSVTIQSVADFVLSGDFQNRDDSGVLSNPDHAHAETMVLELRNSSDIVVTPTSSTGAFPLETTSARIPNPKSVVTRTYGALAPGTYTVRIVIGDGQGAVDNVSFIGDVPPPPPFDDLATYNVVWDSPSADHNGSMPLGNGDIGVNVWCEADGDLIFYISKMDAWSENGRFLKLGRIRVNMSPNPFATGKPFKQELVLIDGKITITAGTPGSDEVRMSMRIDANQPVICIDADSDAPLTWQAKLEVWRTSDYTIANPGDHKSGTEEMRSWWSLQNLNKPLVVHTDTVVAGQSNRVVWYHRNPTSIWQDTLDLQSLGHLNAAPHNQTDPLLNRTFGATMSGAALIDGADDSTLVSSAPSSAFKLRIVPHTAITNTAAEWESQVAALATQIAALDEAQLATDHATWWNAFWQRHQMFVSNTTISRGYNLQRFMNACAGRGAFPIRFQGSMFTVDGVWKGIDHGPDWRNWGGCYWWQNTRLPYWGMFASGDYEFMQPLFDMYLDALPLARERNQKYYGIEGGYFPETLHFWGAAAGYDYSYDWDSTGQTLGKADSPWTRWEFQGGIELTSMMLTYYDHTKDTTFVATKLLPLADDMVKYYDQRFPRANAKLSITPAQALETYWEGIVGPMPEIAGLRNILPRLLALPGITPAQTTAWTRLLGELPPLPVTGGASSVFKVAEALNGVARTNLEYPDLYAIFPYRHYGMGRPDLELARRSYDNRLQQGQNEFGWAQDPIFAAMMGRSADAKARVTNYFNGDSNSISRFPAFWGPNHDWTPDQDHGGVAVIALQEMAIQFVGDRILLFQGWPADWDATFRFHAPGNTTVEGKLVDGQITELKVDPIDRYADVESALGSIPALTGWDLWRTTTPGAGINPDDNGDQDAFDDLLEYALGSDPADSASPEIPPRIEADGSAFLFQFERPTGLNDINYILESSPDLTPNSWSEVDESPVITPIDSSEERVTFSLNTDPDRVFFRLQIKLI